MLNSLLIDSEQETLTSLRQMLDTYCPQINVCGEAKTLSNASRLIIDKNPELVFFNVALLLKKGYCLVDQLSSVDYEVIVVTDCYEHAIDAIKCSVAGYVIKPVQKEDLVIAVNNASGRV